MGELLSNFVMGESDPFETAYKRMDENGDDKQTSLIQFDKVSECYNANV